MLNTLYVYAIRLHTCIENTLIFRSINLTIIFCDQMMHYIVVYQDMCICYNVVDISISAINFRKHLTDIYNYLNHIPELK